MTELMHRERKVEQYTYPASSKNSKLVPDVVAEVWDESPRIMLKIPRQDWETTDLEMSYDCARAIVEVLSVAVTTAKANHALLIERNKEEMKNE